MRPGAAEPRAGRTIGLFNVDQPAVEASTRRDSPDDSPGCPADSAIRAGIPQRPREGRDGVHDRSAG